MGMASGPVRYPELTEQAIVDRHIEEQDREFVERYGHRFSEKKPKPVLTEQDSSDEPEDSEYASISWEGVGSDY